MESGSGFSRDTGEPPGIDDFLNSLMRDKPPDQGHRPRSSTNTTKATSATTTRDQSTPDNPDNPNNPNNPDNSNNPNNRNNPDNPNNPDNETFSKKTPAKNDKRGRG